MHRLSRGATFYLQNFPIENIMIPQIRALPVSPKARFLQVAARGLGPGTAENSRPMLDVLRRTPCSACLILCTGLRRHGCPGPINLATGTADHHVKDHFRWGTLRLADIRMAGAQIPILDPATRPPLALIWINAI